MAHCRVLPMLAPHLGSVVLCAVVPSSANGAAHTFKFTARVALAVLQVIRLLSQLAARLPDIVGLLQPNFDESAAVLIRQGFAQVREAVASHGHDN